MGTDRAKGEAMNSYQQHRNCAAAVSVGCAIITVSDRRTESDDASGALIRRLLSEAGHKEAAYRIVPNQPAELDALLEELLNRAEVEAIFTSGGTGISRRDRTVEAVQKKLDRTLDGFGELFRMLSWQEIGSGAMLSRAVAGVAGKKLLFAMPGSTSAVELAITKLILPELGHLAAELTKA
jgi:molybdopterin adenylyltransferase